MGETIAVLVPSSSDKRGQVMAKQLSGQFPTARIVTVNLRNIVGRFWVPKKNTKASYETTPEGAAGFEKTMSKLAGQYTAFVCIDPAAACYLMPEEDLGSLKDTDKLGGMLITAFDKPCLIHPDPLHMYGRMYDDEHKAAAAFVSQFYVKKLWNAVHGRDYTERPVKFMVPTSVKELKACESLAARSKLIAFDIENSGGFTSCVGFACEVGAPVVPVFVIPVMINLDESDDGMFWSNDAMFNAAMDCIKNVLENDVPKVAHNGAYDITHLFRMAIAPNNYIFDTQIMMHAMWPTVSRALYVGASMFLHGYRYWKDDAKDVGEDGKVKWQVPKTPEKTFRYWHYNGLDCANTLELCLAILRLWMGETGDRYPKVVSGFNHVWLTYIREFALEFGPCLYMSMSGLNADPIRQFAMKEKLGQEADEKAEYLSALVGDPNFNPNSSAHVATLIYDVLDIKPLARKGRTTDKRILQKFADMHPLYKDVIESVWAVKEPRNNISKYCENDYWKGNRMLYQIKASATTTRRCASSKHNFRYGTNFQNIGKPMRVLYEAFPGELLCSSDYSQSDSYFVAFESQDTVMMETVLDDRDTHSVHVEFFFGFPYEDVVKGDAEKAPWVVDPVTGVRQIIKKVSHGTNYDMGGETMLLNVRRDAAIELVNALLASPNNKLFIKYMGLDQSVSPMTYHGKGALWSDAQLAKACEFAQRLYYARYPRLAKWKKDAVGQAAMDHGVIHMFGGSTTTMMTRAINNPRFVPAAYGQGGTAGNINNAMLRLYINADWMWHRGFRMLIQVHDELVAGIPEYDLELVAAKVEIMETPCTIKGRTFSIPVGSELSRSWDPKNVVKWRGLDDEKTVDWYLKQVAEKEAKTRRGLGLT